MTKLNELRKLIIEKKSDMVTTRELSGLGYDKAWLKYALKTLVDEKLLYRLKNGYYSKVNPDSMDPLKAANALFGGYIGLLSAAYLYGWQDEYQYTIFLLTQKSSGRFRIGRHEIKVIAAGRRFEGSCHYNGGLTVSTKAKTLFDLLHYINFLGFDAVIKCLENTKISGKEWNEFINYCLKFGTKSFMQKSGYLLEKFSRSHGELEKLIPKKPVVAKLGNEKKCLFNKRWMVYDCLGDVR